MEEEDINNPIYNNLKDSVDFSRILVDNAKQLYDLNKRSSSELFRGFKDSSRVLSKTLDELSLNYKRYISYEISHKEALKEVEKLERSRNDLIGRRVALEGTVLKQKQEEYNEALRLEQKAKNELNKSSKINASLKEKQQEKYKEALKNLNQAERQLDILKSTLSLTKDLEDKSSITFRNLQKYVEVLNKVQGKVSLIERVYTSISKIPLAGGFVDVEKGVNIFQKSLIAKEGFWTSLRKSIGGAFSSLGKISLWAIAFETLRKVIVFFKDAMFGADKVITDISRKMSITKDNASKVREEFIWIAKEAHGLAKTQDGIIILSKEVYETWDLINEQLGTATKFNGAFLAQMTVINKKIGLNTEALKGLTFATKAGAESAEDLLINITDNNKLLTLQGKSLIGNNKLLDSSLKIVGQLRALYKGNTEEISKGVIQAQLMGTSLERINDSAKGFLDFESSISAELEAQLLTGKNINLDAARYYSLIGDTNKLMGEISKNFPGWEEFSNMNRIAQEGYAKALNMSVDQLSDMVFEQQTLNKLSTDGKNIALSKLSSEARMSVMNAKTFKELSSIFSKFNVDLTTRNELLGQQAYLTLQNQSAEDKFNQSIEKLKETFSNLVTGGVLDKFADVLVAVVNALSKGITGVFEIGNEYEKAQLDRAKLLAKSDPNFAKELENSRKQRTVIGFNGINQEQIEGYDGAKVSRLLGKQYEKQDDFIVKGNNVIPFRKDDLVMGGTNLDGSNGDLKELNKNIKVLIDLVRDGKDVNIDGYKVGVAVGLSAIKTQ